MHEQDLHQLITTLLVDKKVDLVIGFAAGSLPFRTEPVICTDETTVRRVVWNPFCGNNLARYLKYFKNSEKKIGILAKGCDARSLLVLLSEEQISRDHLVIIGLPCQGIINLEKLQKAFPRSLPADFAWNEKGFLHRGTPQNLFLLLENTCQRCRYPNPPLFDFLVGEKVPGSHFAEQKQDYLTPLDALSSQERWEYLSKELSRCIRCYACRNACPLCYCQECFAESTRPQWVSPAPSFSDNCLFHLGRTMHMAGRCVECGACERACPENIPIALLPLKVEAIIREDFHFESGVEEGTVAPLLTYKENDPGEFIK